MHGMNREPFFGSNARAWFIQLAFVIAFVVLAGPFLKQWIGDGLCYGLNFCSKEQRAQMSAPAPQ